jgi:hypothetical protein
MNNQNNEREEAINNARSALAQAFQQPEEESFDRPLFDIGEGEGKVKIIVELNGKIAQSETDISEMRKLQEYHGADGAIELLLVCFEDALRKVNEKQ